ncbi:MAG: prephenate dehydratase, partial [Acidobacteria bacterium]|nr:prephenate dehydratase [Acidobacteriota bacterium]
IPSVFDEVSCGRANFGVVPVENSNEGAVSHTLDMFLTSRLAIIAENYLEISHDLLSKSGRLQDIKAIYSHPQALAQCRNWLDENLPDIPRIEVPSTARAAQIVADDESGVAIACGAAANLYGLQVVVNKIEDYHYNYTRFLVIGPEMPAPSGNDRTSILFSFRDEPGILSKMLEPFRQRGINLMKIESRPVKNTAFEYVFFLDAAGHITDADLSAAIEELKPYCALLKVLGSYPRAR